MGNCDMSDWVVVYGNITRGTDDVRATSSSKEAALKQAAALMRQGHEVHRIEGPNGEMIGKEQIKAWVAAHPLY